MRGQYDPASTGNAARLPRRRSLTIECGIVEKAKGQPILRMGPAACPVLALVLASSSRVCRHVRSLCKLVLHGCPSVAPPLTRKIHQNCDDTLVLRTLVTLCGVERSWKPPYAARRWEQR